MSQQGNYSGNYFGSYQGALGGAVAADLSATLSGAGAIIALLSTGQPYSTAGGYWSDRPWRDVPFIPIAPRRPRRKRQEDLIFLGR